ncbi:MAG: pyridoxamine 5'-phosphate oxidase [Brevundimonas sp.]|uniref:Pyridoxine/pyridoxamine 5'-phosphate oxidase n=1 Tax=Brevundimonas albigilva TaxID=1312364 RepID=A0ABY4SFT0_9CAUL|nr:MULTISPECIES: pyridoxamine 5'-phosphate oxidase [Brevundimonas]PZU54683.1 MAG: pyridoxamine 5'-phosphate oxidase [Brevundimonas sp.]UQV18153.1 pyridoxamine 5'-phosphate oxidase [Brevundimonas albigilva]URI13886.1 pyridoxamine 5'-phosphate oxidase [Brevundimonas albigilva]
MTAPVIPPSPSREEYARDYAAALAANSDDAAFERAEPVGLFVDWLADARAHEVNDANAMTLSTVDAEGLPDARIVLLKDVDGRGFTFYSNRESAKGLELDARPVAALTFHWKSLRRQVRVRGAVQPVTADEADAYFASRARESRIGAWASDQSRPLPDRAALEAAVARETARFDGQDVPRPARWSGWRVVPSSVEFWRDRPFRLHDRMRFDRDGDGWRKTRLWP